MSEEIDWETNPTTMKLHHVGGVKVAALVRGDGIDLALNGGTYQFSVSAARSIANAMLAAASESERDER